jgi:twitching motility protein PilT
VGRDTPSFEQALIDAMREDPDVLMVGEMRDPETMRLTLNAAETGHLVLATVHSSTATEALQRVASAFSPEIQSSVCAQLADCMVAVVCQRLQYRDDLKNFVRRGEFFKVVSMMETGAEQGMWTYHRYRTWLETRKTWHFPEQRNDEESPMDGPEAEEIRMPLPSPPAHAPVAAPKVHAPDAAAPLKSTGGALEIVPEEGGLEAIITKLKNKP